jgi:hypothetical protein
MTHTHTHTHTHMRTDCNRRGYVQGGDGQEKPAHAVLAGVKPEACCERRRFDLTCACVCAYAQGTVVNMTHIHSRGLSLSLRHTHIYICSSDVPSASTNICISLPSSFACFRCLYRRNCMNKYAGKATNTTITMKKESRATGKCVSEKHTTLGSSPSTY